MLLCYIAVSLGAFAGVVVALLKFVSFWLLTELSVVIKKSLPGMVLDSLKTLR